MVWYPGYQFFVGRACGRHDLAGVFGITSRVTEIEGGVAVRPDAPRPFPSSNGRAVSDVDRLFSRSIGILTISRLHPACLSLG